MVNRKPIARMNHWIEILAAEFGPNAKIDVEIDTMRKVDLSVTVVSAGKKYNIRRTMTWGEFENAGSDPFSRNTYSIILEWRRFPTRTTMEHKNSKHLFDSSVEIGDRCHSMPEEHDDDVDWLSVGIIIAGLTVGFWLCMLFFR